MIVYYKHIQMNQDTKNLLLQCAFRDYFARPFQDAGEDLLIVPLEASELENVEQQYLFWQEEKGKPRIKGYSQVHFSVTHTDDWWICGIGSEPLGIDCESLERHVRQWAHLAKRFFTLEEYEYLMGVSEGNAEEEFLRLWVKKEAYVKYTGRGLGQGLNEFSVLHGKAPEGEFAEIWIDPSIYVVCCRKEGETQ